jgi:hypothetical protein
MGRAASGLLPVAVDAGRIQQKHEGQVVRGFVRPFALDGRQPTILRRVDGKKIILILILIGIFG